MISRSLAASSRVRPINIGAVIAATVRETSPAELARRIYEWRDAMATYADYQAPTVTPAMKWSRLAWYRRAKAGKV